MRKRTKLILSISIIFIVGVVFACMFIYQLQYNSKGMGRYLCIERNQSGWITVGNSGGMDIMTYNLEEPYAINIKGEKVYLNEAIRSNQLTIQDLCKYPDRVITSCDDGINQTHYYFENYQIIDNGKYYIIDATGD